MAARELVKLIHNHLIRLKLTLLHGGPNRVWQKIMSRMNHLQLLFALRFLCC